MTPRSLPVLVTTEPPLTLADLTRLSAQLVLPLMSALVSETRRIDRDGVDYRREVTALPKERIPDEVLRAQLEAYKGRLSREASPNLTNEAQEARRAVVVATLFATLQSDKIDKDAQDLRMGFWLELIADRPAIELEIAAAWWTGCKHMDEDETARNRSFAPRPAELLRLADLAREMIASQIKGIDRLLNAEAAVGNGGYSSAHKSDAFASPEEIDKAIGGYLSKDE